MAVNFIYIISSSFILMVVYILYRRLQLATVRNRSVLFDECDSILDAASKSYEQNGFPILEGNYHGFHVRLNLVPDTIVMRKVPPLWLMITVKANRPSKGTMDFIVRPQNIEFYSPGWLWDGHFKTPSHWPQYSIAKYKKSVASIEVLDKFVPHLFEDEKVKQLLVTPGKIRITFMVKQAIRGDYLLTRGAIFDNQPIDKSKVKKILRLAILIRKNLEEDCAL